MPWWSAVEKFGLAYLQDVKQVRHHPLGEDFPGRNFKQAIFAFETELEPTVDVM